MRGGKAAEASPMPRAGEEKQRRPSLCPREEPKRSRSWSAGSRLARRPGPCSQVMLIAGHLETFMRSVYVWDFRILRHHQSLNEHVDGALHCLHTCAWHMCTCQCLNGAMCTVRTAAYTHVCVYDCMLEGV